jgi:hypothetical protein
MGSLVHSLIKDMADIGSYNWHKRLQQSLDLDEFIWASRHIYRCFGYSSLSYSTKMEI